MLLPLYVVNALSYQVYFFHPSEYESRVGTTATYFLAAFAMLFVIADLLPKTDFLTLIDRIIIFTTASLAAGGAISTILYVFITRGMMQNALGVYSENVIALQSEAASKLNRLAVVGVLVRRDAKLGRYGKDPEGGSWIDRVEEVCVPKTPADLAPKEFRDSAAALAFCGHL